MKIKTNFSYPNTNIFFVRNEIINFCFKIAFLPTSTPLCIFFDFPIRESNKNQKKKFKKYSNKNDKKQNIKHFEGKVKEEEQWIILILLLLSFFEDASTVYSSLICQLWKI